MDIQEQINTQPEKRRQEEDERTGKKPRSYNMVTIIDGGLEITMPDFLLSPSTEAGRKLVKARKELLKEHPLED
ncbi:MAG TPA: hypothetical protein PLC54_08080 [Spirochaetales bacterium]|nr:hypothetical protein [Spirochaetales bacterium]